MDDVKLRACSRLFRHGTISSCDQFNIESYGDKLHALPWEPVVAPSNRKLITRYACWLTRNPCSCPYKYGRKHWAPSPMPSWLEYMGDTLVAGLRSVGVPLKGYAGNGCNANMYSDHRHSLYWHSDDEALFRKSEFERDVLIISISFGAPREFRIRLKYSHLDKDHYNRTLSDGDILTMERAMQDKYEHAVQGSSVSDASMSADFRYNLTFRMTQRHCKACRCFVPSLHDS